MKPGYFITYCKGVRRFLIGPFFIINSKHRKWFYKTPFWIRCILVIFFVPEQKLPTREQEILGDYLAAKHDHK